MQDDTKATVDVRDGADDDVDDGEQATRVLTKKEKEKLKKERDKVSKSNCTVKVMYFNHNIFRQKRKLKRRMPNLVQPIHRLQDLLS